MLPIALLTPIPTLIRPERDWATGPGACPGVAPEQRPRCPSPFYRLFQPERDWATGPGACPGRRARTAPMLPIALLSPRCTGLDGTRRDSFKAPGACPGLRAPGRARPRPSARDWDLAPGACRASPARAAAKSGQVPSPTPPPPIIALKKKSQVPPVDTGGALGAHGFFIIK